MNKSDKFLCCIVVACMLHFGVTMFLLGYLIGNK